MPARLQKSSYSSSPSGYRTVEAHHTLVTTRVSADRLRKTIGADVKEFRLPHQEEHCDPSTFDVPDGCSKEMGVNDKRFVEIDPGMACYASCASLSLEMEFDRQTEILDLADTTDHPILVSRHVLVV